MNSRQRVQNALSFKPVDIVPLQIHPSPAGLYEHGQKLLDLMRSCEQDFVELAEPGLPQVPKEDYDAEGRYHKIATDEWGTTWEYRIYGIWGYRIKYPLADISLLDGYQFPPLQRLQGEALKLAQADAVRHRQQYYYADGFVSLFETMQSLRPFEDVLIDITQDSPGINRLVDRLVEYYAVEIENALLKGVDAIQFGDDFGTQQSLLLSPNVWRRSLTSI